MSEILTTILRGAIDDMQKKLFEAKEALAGAELLRESIRLTQQTTDIVLPNSYIQKAYNSAPATPPGLFRDAMMLGFQLKADELDKKALACVNAIAQRAGVGVDEVTTESEKPKC